MKELSIEEKAKRYDEVREKIAIRFGSNVADEIFSEYEESEDERIRKSLIDMLKNDEKCYLKEIAWLEKQVEQPKKISIWKHWKDGIAGNAEGKLIYLVKLGDTYNLSSGLSFECDYIELSELDSLMLEKQGEQKHKIQPKFKIGDIIRFKGNETLKGEAETHKIVSYDNELYVFADGTTDLFCEQDLYELVEQNHIDKVEPMFKVKYDGSEYNVFEIKDIAGVTFYGIEDKTIHIDYVKAENCEIVSEQKPDDKKGMNFVEEEMTPFQKKVFCIIDTTIEEEQGLKQVCDELLALASNEIKQNSAWNEEDEAIYYGVIETEQYMLEVVNGIKKFDVGNISIKEECTRELNWLKSLKDRVQPQPKQEWSEEDGTELMNTIIMLKEGASFHFNKKDITKAVDFLRTFKDRYTWKPSNEQMKALKDALNDAICQYDFKGSLIKEEVTRKHAETIESLYNDLKKLKE